MKSTTLLLTTCILFSLLGSTCKNQKFHPILSIPFEANREFFVEVCKADSFFHECYWVEPCGDAKLKLQYVPFYCGRSLRHFYDTLASEVKPDSFFIYVPFYQKSPSKITNKKMVNSTGTTTSVEVGNSPMIGTRGCNAFMMKGEQTQDAELKVGDSSSTIAKGKIGCHLDYFNFSGKRYINLLFVSHDEHLEHCDTIVRFTNVDFPIKLKDYNILNSLLRESKTILGGIDIESPKKLNIYETVPNKKFITFIMADTMPNFNLYKPFDPYLSVSN